nr:MAG TPA: protein of unknown function (DUF4815) [Bacteriophage sp.]
MDKYYNQFDHKKNYKNIMFRASMGLQSTELNELQSILMHEFNTVVSTLYGDGSVLKGGTVTVTDKNIHISGSTILAKNWTHIIPETQLTITANGTEIIGIALKETEVTEHQDESLRDPAVGARNYKEPGAGRLKVDSRFCLESDKQDGEQFFPIFTFKDGVFISNTKIAPELEGAKNMIARYDNNSNGSYVIEGMILTYDSDDNVNERHKFTVSSGEGHVEGYEVNFQYDRPLYIPFNKDTRSVEAEPHTFNSNGEYKLRNNPLNVITKLLGIKRVTETITHGNFSGSSDRLPKSPVVKVISVKQGGTVYKETQDYRVDGDQINWDPSGAEPAPGSTYQVEYQYTTADTIPQISSDRKSIIVNGLDAGTLFYVSYSYFIPRIDRVLLTREGEFKILQGTPTPLNPKAPAHTTLLSLGTIKVLSGSKPEVTLDYFRAFKMSDIQSLFNTINEVKYNIARLALKDDIRQMEPSTVKKNTFVDPFFDDDLRDMGRLQNALINRRALCLTTNFEVTQINDSNFVILPYTESVEIENRSQTKARKINEFLFVTPPDPKLTIEPNVYKWVDKKITLSSITIQGGWWGNYDEVNTVKSNETAIIPRINIKVKGSGFNGNEAVDVVFDNRPAIVLQAGPTGVLDSQFQIPSNVNSGDKSVVITGQQSKATTTLVFTATPLIEQRRTVYVYRKRDPLGQTFTADRPFFLSSVDLLIKNLPNDYIEVGICTTLAGVPDRSKILDIKRVNKSELTVNQWNKFKFDAPIYVEQGTEYAILVITNDAVAEVAVSELGQYDPVNNKWVSSQAYATGVLLNSSNLSTWSALQKEDLSFAINRSVFQNTFTKELKQVIVTNKTDLMLVADIDLYPDTNISFVATLLDRDDEKVILTPNTPSYVTAYTGRVKVEAILKSSSDLMSPVTLPDIYLAHGKVETPSTYISRQFKKDGDTIKVYLEIYEPTASFVNVSYEKTDNNFVAMTKKNTQAINLGDGWVDMLYEITDAGVENTRIKIDLSTSDTNVRPLARNLRAYII